MTRRRYDLHLGARIHSSQTPYFALTFCALAHHERSGALRQPRPAGCAISENGGMLPCSGRILNRSLSRVPLRCGRAAARAGEGVSRPIMRWPLMGQTACGPSGELAGSWGGGTVLSHEFAKFFRAVQSPDRAFPRESCIWLPGRVRPASKGREIACQKNAVPEECRALSLLLPKPCPNPMANRHDWVSGA